VGDTRVLSNVERRELIRVRSLLQTAAREPLRLHGAVAEAIRRLDDLLERDEPESITFRPVPVGKRRGWRVGLGDGVLLVPSRAIDEMLGVLWKAWSSPGEPQPVLNVTKGNAQTRKCRAQRLVASYSPELAEQFDRIEVMGDGEDATPVAIFHLPRSDL
jgi:hypothetical protein